MNWLQHFPHQFNVEQTTKLCKCHPVLPSVPFLTKASSAFSPRTPPGWRVRGQRQRGPGRRVLKILTRNSATRAASPLLSSPFPVNCCTLDSCCLCHFPSHHQPYSPPYSLPLFYPSLQTLWLAGRRESVQEWEERELGAFW